MSTKIVEVYSIGICYASVCAHESLSIEDIIEQVNALHPAGTMNGWQPSEDKTFKTGATNPCSCDQKRGFKHYLFEC